MATIKSPWATGSKPMPAPAGSEVVNVLLELPVTAAQTALNDVYVMGELPADCVLVDAVYASTDIDSATAHSMAFGVVNDDENDLATTLESDIVVGRTGVAARMTPTVETLTTKGTGTAGKTLGYKVTAASGTGVAGTVYLSVSYRAAAFGG